MGEDISVRKDKWEKYAHVVDTTSSSKRATFELTAQYTIDLLGERRSGVLLDIGCGFGEIDVLLAQNTNFEIIGCDVSKKCVSIARKNAELSGMERRIKIEEGDVYKLVYPDNYFDVIVSFGYVSAATYKGAQSEVARVLKPGGLLICDFINSLSIYKITNLPRRWRKLINEEGKHYNTATLQGISEYFSRYNLQLVSQMLFNSYPPINFLPAECLILFDKSIGRALNKILGRVRLVCFQKK